MRRELVWGRSIWVWRAHALVATACLVLAVLSETLSGRAFPIMVIVAQAFLIAYGWFKRREARQIRDQWGIDDDGVWSGA